jgi:16S rRNA (guanine527-N7)-methyltransferase
MNERTKDLLLESALQMRLELTSSQVNKFVVFAGELVKWNRKVNLTAITDDRDIVVKHFADSLVLLKVIGSTGNLLDIGSGGGFPSIPLKIMLPTLSAVSVDAAEKKILFQRHVARLLQLEHFTAVHARCEDLHGEYAEKFDWIVSRAFSDIANFAKMALPLLKGNGLIIAMKGKRGGDEASLAALDLADMGVTVVDVMNLSLPITGDPRSLVIMKKLKSINT